MTEYAILIAAFNEASDIGRTIDALGKTEGCREFIVVDVGSLGRTTEVARGHGTRMVNYPIGFVFILAIFVYFVDCMMMERVHITESKAALFTMVDQSPAWGHF